MPVKPDKSAEQVSLPDIAALTGARWFAGKERTVAGIEHVGEVALEGAPGASIALIELVYDEGESERYALALRDGRECDGDDPVWAALARRGGADAAPGKSRFLAEDLSNTVVLLEDRLVLKLFRRLERGPHPEADLLGVLAGSSEVPEILGVVEHDDTVVALVEEYVAGVPVGWEGLIERLAAGDEALDDARDLGRLAAAIHTQLATLLGTRVGDAADVDAERTAAAAAIVTVEPSPAIGARLAELDRLIGAPVQRVHGDLHVGQVLRTSGGLVAIDFEGDPSLSLAQRARERSALVDLASLLLSLDHAGCAARRRVPSFDWRAWSRQARARCMDAYKREAGPVDRELLRALEVAKELRELDYATRWLPEWLYAPRAVLPTLLEDGA